MPEGNAAIFASPEPSLDLSVIVVSFNSRDVLRDTLRSALATLGAAGAHPPAWELFVSDNASSDGSADMVEREFPSVRLLRNPQNLGFSYGNNQALRLCRGRHVLLLNSDTLPARGLFDGLVDFLDTHPEAGACSPRLVSRDGRPQRFAFGGDPLLPYLLRRLWVRLLFRRDVHDWGTADLQETDWVSGACLAVRREAVQAAGLMDEGFFVYFEDADWCRRIRSAGWKVYYVPALSVVHIGGATLGRSAFSRAQYRQSLRRYRDKHYSGLARWLSRLAF